MYRGEEVKNSIINLKANEEIVIEERDGEKWIYLNTFYNCEKNVALKLMLLNRAKNIKRISNFKKELLETEKRVGIELSEEQKQAIEMVNNNNVCIITGGPRNRKNYYY